MRFTHCPLLLTQQLQSRDESFQVGLLLFHCSVWFICDPADCSPSAHGTSQARILEWVAIASSRWSPLPRNPTCVSCISCIGRKWSSTCKMRQCVWMVLDAKLAQDFSFFFFFPVNFIVLESEVDYWGLLMELWGSRTSRSSRFRGKKCSHCSQIAGYWGGCLTLLQGESNPPPTHTLGALLLLSWVIPPTLALFPSSHPHSLHSLCHLGREPPISWHQRWPQRVPLPSTFTLTLHWATCSEHPLGTDPRPPFRPHLSHLLALVFEMDPAGIPDLRLCVPTKRAHQRRFLTAFPQ